MADEMRCNGLTPRKLGTLMLDLQEKATQTTKKHVLDVGIECCNIKSKQENDKSEQILKLQLDLVKVQEENKNMLKVIIENDALKQQVTEFEIYFFTKGIFKILLCSTEIF